MQVLGRIVAFPVARGALLPALLGLALTNSWLLIAVSVRLSGVSDGVTTIVRSISRVELFGRENYAQVNGAIAVHAIISRSLGPLLASSLLARWPGYLGVFFLLTNLAGLSLFLPPRCLL